MSKGVDPHVYDLADDFVTDLLAGLKVRPLDFMSRERLTQRVAEAAQKAIEDECTAIEEELHAPEREGHQSN